MTKLEKSEGNSSICRWYAVATLPNKEAVAVEHLKRQGFNTFCPLELVLRRHARRAYKVHVPIFRGYVFVSLDPKVARWRSINGTWGVRSVIATEDGPVAVREGVVETMIASTDATGVLCYADPYQSGMTVRLRSGPLADELGVIERLDGSSRVQLLMRFLGSNIRASVEKGAILTLT